MTLTETNIDRYSRQILLPEIGGKGQAKLLNSKVLIVGVGGLGSPVAYYLAAAGVGTLGLVDFDKVEINNLQRQILHTEESLNTEKVLSAKSSLNKLNSDVTINEHVLKLDSNNAQSLLQEYDIIVDGTDSIETKFLLNDMCVQLKKPFVHAGILRYEGQLMTILPGKACLRCLFREELSDEDSPSCREAGILGAVAGVMGTLQANEVIKTILGSGELITNRMLIFNALESSFREITVKQNKKCGCYDSEKK